MNYLPFDLETALKHPERVVTRDGRKVKQLYNFDDYSNSMQSLAAIVGDGIKTFWETGEWDEEKNKHGLDLFLLPEVKKVWVNVYETEKGIWVGPEFQTKVKAIDGINEDCGKYIKTILITNEPE